MIHGLVDNLEECEAAEREIAHAIARADSRCSDFICVLWRGGMK